ncbi:MAG TPA: type II secretion system protein GspH [Serratia grimesii]|uniref:Type II secretion system protein H n=1 Tax=Serratia grimesii TaxID=82995 RepID=A0A9C7QTL2_9GAMM|nr:type II secretion system minor pseudopilin GspH [Serratia grimesii]HCK00066.1 type II secretion system protein GspH [Serratia grimesii]
MRGNIRGFSLLEIMLVLVLLGGLATLVIGALPGAPSLKQHEERLSAQLQWAAERAVQEGQVYGVAVAAREWQLVKLVRAPQGEHASYYWPGHYWQPVSSSNKPPQPTLLPESVNLRLILEEHPHPLRATLQEQGLEPQMLLMPGGEVSRFELQLLTENQPPRTVSLKPERLR